jgi:DDE superfamily endonuclease
MVEENAPAGLDVNVVMDNASSHTTKLIRSWPAKKSRWHAHFTPTSASWINQVERYFGPLTNDQIRRGAHRSARELEAAITSHSGARNSNSKPFSWIKSADDILASVQRFCQRTKAVQDQCL